MISYQKPVNPMAKSTKAEIKRRVKAISTLLLNGASRADILQYATKTDWDVSDGMIDKYIAKANEGFKQSATFDNGVELGKALNRLQRLYMSHLENKDYRDALAVQKEINKLLGLYAPERKEVTGAGGGAIIIRTGMDLDEI